MLFLLTLNYIWCLCFIWESEFSLFFIHVCRIPIPTKLLVIQKENSRTIFNKVLYGKFCDKNYYLVKAKSKLNCIGIWEYTLDNLPYTVKKIYITSILGHTWTFSRDGPGMIACRLCIKKSYMADRGVTRSSGARDNFKECVPSPKLEKIKKLY